MDERPTTDGFERAFETLYPQARSVALRILGSIPAAEDAAAEALTRALVDWTRIGALPYRDAWVLRVTANVAIDAARKRRPEPVDAAPADDDAIVGDVAVLRVTLVAALAALPRRQREAIVLRHLVGLPEADVAAAMQLSPNSVKKHLQRGLAKLRRLVPEEGADLVLA
ncbi:MAG: RNA polymerase sigma factor [Aquihabitans sp.]